MKLTPYELQTNITNMARHHFESQPSAEDTRARFNSYIAQLKLDDKTRGGKLRYPKKTLGELQRLWRALSDTYTSIYCVFGYWYEGEFYTTYKGIEGLKTTEILHNLEPRLTSAQWDKLECGLYYKDTLKKYY